MSVLREHRLFVYGSLLTGEPDHGLLGTARSLGPAQTTGEYQLVELTGFPALVRGGQRAVRGELYVVDAAILRQLDRKKEHPILFRRESITLADASSAEAYLMQEEQVRGRRRLKVDDWRDRFRPAPTGIPASAWSRWARSRSDKR
jgi:gamma-glutamylaminecyclotransferase